MGAQLPSALAPRPLRSETIGAILHHEFHPTATTPIIALPSTGAKIVSTDYIEQMRVRHPHGYDSSSITESDLIAYSANSLTLSSRYYIFRFELDSKVLLNIL